MAKFTPSRQKKKRVSLFCARLFVTLHAKSNIDMKKVIVFALAALTFAACQESLEEKAAREAELYTKKNCPSLIAKNMTMDSLTFEANTHTLHFYYTLSGEADTVGVMNQIDAKTLLLSELKNTTAMLAYKDAGYNFAYTYHSQKNPQVVIFQTIFSEKDYKAEAPAQKD